MVNKRGDGGGEEVEEGRRLAGWRHGQKVTKTIWDEEEPRGRDNSTLLLRVFLLLHVSPGAKDRHI